MSRYSQLYIWGIVLTGASIAGTALFFWGTTSIDGALFAVLTVLTVLSQLLGREKVGRHSYYLHFTFYFAGILLLPLPLFIAQVIVAHLIEWAKARIEQRARLQSWFAQPFNIATHIVAGASAYALYNLSDINGIMQISPRAVAAVFSAAGVYVVINHLLVGGALFIVRDISWNKSNVLSLDSLLSDFVPACLGYLVAVLWHVSPWLILPALAPLALIRQALKAHVLEGEARLDNKTGLLNTDAFLTMVEEERVDAERTEHPVVLIMADVDFLRNINNTYGYVAGDAVLVGVADIIRETIRERGVACRFGGEEFAIMLPDTRLEEAEGIAEHIRSTVESAQFESETLDTTIQTTLSLGVACLPTDAMASKALIHEADLAMYRAKLLGRNQVVSARDLPRSYKAASVSTIYHRPEATKSTVQTTSKTDQVENGTVAATASGQSTDPTDSDDSSSLRKLMLPVFVSCAVLLGAGVTGWGVYTNSGFDIRIVAMLVILAIAAEYLYINAYEDSTLSVSVAMLFASALLAGILGVAIVSAVIALTHAVQQRPPWYTVPFNWSIHVISGAAPAVLLGKVALPTSTEKLVMMTAAGLLAALLYFALETGLVAAAISLSSGRSVTFVWNKQFRWLIGPHIILAMLGIFLSISVIEMGLPGMIVFTLPVFMMRYSQKQYVERTQAGVQELKRMNQELDTANREIRHANRAIRELNDGLFETLAKIIDARDPFNKGHAVTVADYAVEIGRELDLAADRIHVLRQAGLLHDIGKLGIPETILFKPDKLTSREYEQIKQHATIGAQFLATAQGLQHLVPFVKHHHERWDGAGYPSGLAGEDIPLEARILAVCDAVEAMASDRPYSTAKPLEEIIAELRRNKGGQFDPMVTEAFLRVISRKDDDFVRNSAAIVIESREDLVYALTHMPSPAA